MGGPSWGPCTASLWPPALSSSLSEMTFWGLAPEAPGTWSTPGAEQAFSQFILGSGNCG